jgi:hypothetical protein
VWPGRRLGGGGQEWHHYDRPDVFADKTGLKLALFWVAGSEKPGRIIGQQARVNTEPGKIQVQAGYRAQNALPMLLKRAGDVVFEGNDVQTCRVAPGFRLGRNAAQLVQERQAPAFGVVDGQQRKAIRGIGGFGHPLGAIGSQPLADASFEIRRGRRADLLKTIQTKPAELFAEIV